MKKTGYIVFTLGVAVVIFSIVCFIIAGKMLNEIEQYMGIMSGYMDAGDMLDMVLDSGMEVSDFRIFAYQARVWLLVGGLVMLASGTALIFAGRKNTSGGYGQQFIPVYNGYDEYDDATVAVAHHAATASVICPACGTACSANAVFCRNCGTALGAPEPSGKICPACGTENDADARFCRECGQKLGEEACDDAPASSSKIYWDEFRPVPEFVKPEEAESAPGEIEFAEPEEAEAVPAEIKPTETEEAEAVPDEIEPAEAVHMDTAEPAGVFRKSDSFDAASGEEKPAAENPFLRKAGDL